MNDLREILTSLGPIKNYIFGRRALGVQADADVSLPKKVTDKMKFLISWFGKSDALQEMVGEIGTALVTYAVGFNPVGLKMDRNHGIDILSRHRSNGLWGIFEAKGGKSRLSTGASYGDQMSGSWITHWLKQTATDSPRDSDGIQLRTDLNAGSLMVAGVVRVRFDPGTPRQRVFVKVGVQAYKGNENEFPKTWKGFR